MLRRSEMSNYTVEKDWFYKDLRCVVIMGHMGFRCGYVGIDKTHPLYGIKYNAEIEITENKKKALLKGEVGKRGVISLFSYSLHEKITPEILFDVHGGITFSGEDKIYPVESDLWWIGFDCGHVEDGKDLSVVSGQLKKIELKWPTGGILRSLEYCTEECESLADQLINFKEE